MNGSKDTALSKLGVPGYWICRRPLKEVCEWRSTTGKCQILSKDKPCIDEEVSKKMADEQAKREKEVKLEREKVVLAQIENINKVVVSLNELMDECYDGDAVEHLANAVARSQKAKIALRLWIDKHVKGVVI